MPLQSPNLDDRKYKDIVEEIRGLIPTYAPEWTDWNEHDPGITLIQLFSHLAEMIIYRLNQVPDKNYIEFLKLVGIELKPAVPAKAHLTFTLTSPISEPDKDFVFIPKGATLSAEASGDSEPVIFETDESLKAVAASLKVIQCEYEGSYHQQKLAEDKGNQPFYPFGPKAEKDSAMYLGLDRPLPQDVVSLRIELYSKDRPIAASHCTFEETPMYPSAALDWQYWDGMNNKWQSLVVTQDDTMSLLRSGYLHLRGSAGAVANKVGLVSEELYWVRCLVKAPGFELAPKIDRILLNTVPATNAVTVKEEILGSSDGSPNQRFSVKNTPVVADKVDLDVKEGDKWVRWKEVADFTGSVRDSQHYTLNGITGEIRFGDMVRGKIPFAGNQNIRISYRYGGGKRGNVASGTIKTIETSLQDVDGVTNYAAATGGEDEENLDAALERGPQELKTQHRAVTAQDFEFLATQTPGMRIARAKALPLIHPDFAPEQKMPGVVTVVIVPDSKDNKPMPSEGMIRTVCEHLNKHRLLTTELHVIPPQYRQVKVKAAIIAQNSADLRKVNEMAQEKLKEYYHPLKGGPDQKGWPFGGDIHFSEAYHVILNIPEVKRIKELYLSVDGEADVKCQDIVIPDNFLVYSGDHEITVDYDREER